MLPSYSKLENAYMFYILNLKVPDFHILGVEMLWLMKTISYSPKPKKRMIIVRYGFSFAYLD